MNNIHSKIPSIMISGFMDVHVPRQCYLVVYGKYRKVNSRFAFKKEIKRFPVNNNESLSISICDKKGSCKYPFSMTVT